VLLRSLASARPITRRCSSDHSPVLARSLAGSPSDHSTVLILASGACSRHCSPVLATLLAGACDRTRQVRARPLASVRPATCRCSPDHSPVLVLRPGSARPITHRCSPRHAPVPFRALASARPDTRPCPPRHWPVLSRSPASAPASTAWCATDHHPVAYPSPARALPITPRCYADHSRTRPGAGSRPSLVHPRSVPLGGRARCPVPAPGAHKPFRPHGPASRTALSASSTRHTAASSAKQRQGHTALLRPGPALAIVERFPRPGAGANQRGIGTSGDQFPSSRTRCELRAQSPVRPSRNRIPSRRVKNRLEIARPREYHA